MKIKNTTTVYRTLLVLTLAAISFLATTSETSAAEALNDKVSHVLAFFVLAVLIDGSWPSSRFGAMKFLSLLGYGLFIEMMQHFLPRRSASFMDLAADVIGILLYLCLTAAARRLGLIINRARSCGEETPEAP